MTYTEREIRREIERAFYEYKERKVRANQYVADFATNNLGVDYSRVQVAGGTVNIDTGIVAALENNCKDCLWCRVVEITREHYISDEDKSYILDKYYRGARGERRTRLRDICFELYISEEKAYRLIREILNYAAMIAIQFGLISLVKKL